MTRELVLTTEAGGLTIELARVPAPGVVVIGRSRGCEICLAQLPGADAVSRRHCLIDLTDAGARVFDLGSRNGTLHNGRTIGRRITVEPQSEVGPDGEGCCLNDGDQIGLGEIRIDVSLVETSDADLSELEAYHVA